MYIIIDDVERKNCNWLNGHDTVVNWTEEESDLLTKKIFKNIESAKKFIESFFADKNVLEMTWYDYEGFCFVKFFEREWENQEKDYGGYDEVTHRLRLREVELA